MNSGTFLARLRPELLDDAAKAFAWYEAQAEGVGHDFLRAFYAAVAQTTRQPLIYRKMHADFRRVFLRRFPYSLYFRVDGEEIVFFLLYQNARDPKAWPRMLRTRRESD